MKRVLVFLVFALVAINSWTSNAFAGGEGYIPFGTASAADGTVCTFDGNDNNGHTMPRCTNGSDTTDGTFQFPFFTMTDTSAAKITFQKIIIKNSGTNTNNVHTTICCTIFVEGSDRSAPGGWSQCTGDINKALTNCNANNKECVTGADPTSGGFLPKNASTDSACASTTCNKLDGICQVTRDNSSVSTNSSATVTYVGADYTID